MLIIIEGVDRTGKTTLAQNLAKEFGLEYRHQEKPKQHPLDEYGRPLEAGPINAVMDRYHIGEQVWPEIFQRKSEYDYVMHQWVEDLILSRGGFLIHAQRDPGEIIKACRADGEPIQEEQVTRSSALFGRYIWDWSRLPKCGWELGEDISVAIHEAKYDGIRARQLADITPRWIGDLKPDVLLVGDEVGPTSRGWSLPFVPYRNTSGHFLLGELAAAQFTYAIVNSLQPEGNPRPLEPVGALWEAMGRPRVVALGQAAETRLAGQIPGEFVHRVFHPQYVRRFLRKNGPGWYLNEIRKAAHQ